MIASLARIAKRHALDFGRHWPRPTRLVHRPRASRAREGPADGINVRGPLEPCADGVYPSSRQRNSTLLPRAVDDSAANFRARPAPDPGAPDRPDAAPSPAARPKGWTVRTDGDFLDARRNGGLSRPHLVMLQVLEWYCRDRSHCWVSNAELAARYGCHESTARRLLGEMQGAGLVLRVATPAGAGRPGRVGIVLLRRADPDRPVADGESLADVVAGMLSSRSIARARPEIGEAPGPRRGRPVPDAGDLPTTGRPAGRPPGAGPVAGPAAMPPAVPPRRGGVAVGPAAPSGLAALLGALAALLGALAALLACWPSRSGRGPEAPPAAGPVADREGPPDVVAERLGRSKARASAARKRAPWRRALSSDGIIPSASLSETFPFCR